MGAFEHCQLIVDFGHGHFAPAGGSAMAMTTPHDRFLHNHPDPYRASYLTQSSHWNRGKQTLTGGNVP
jgi:hypothetical protein